MSACRLKLPSLYFLVRTSIRCCLCKIGLPVWNGTVDNLDHMFVEIFDSRFNFSIFSFCVGVEAIHIQSNFVYFKSLFPQGLDDS